jgi:hypothetical protein
MGVAETNSSDGYNKANAASVQYAAPNKSTSVPNRVTNLETGEGMKSFSKTGEDGKDSGGAAGKHDLEGKARQQAAPVDIKGAWKRAAPQIKADTPNLDTLAPALAGNDEKSIRFKPESERKDSATPQDGLKNGGIVGFAIEPFQDQKINSMPDEAQDALALENKMMNSTKIVNGKGVNVYNRIHDADDQKDSYGQTAAQRTQAATTASMLNRIQTMSYTEWNNLTTGQRQDMIDTAAQKLEKVNQAVATDLTKYDAVTKEFLQTKYGQAEGAVLEKDAIKISKETQDKALKEKGYTQADIDAGRVSKAEANQIFANADKYAKEAIQAKYGNDPEKAKDVTDVANGRHGFGIRLAHDASLITGVDKITEQNQTNTGDKGLSGTQALKAQADTTAKDSNYSINDFQQRTAELKNGNTMNATASASTSTPSDTSYTVTQAASQQVQTTTTDSNFAVSGITPIHNAAANVGYQQTAPAMVAAAPQGVGTFDPNAPQATTVAFNSAAKNDAINLTLAQQQQIEAQLNLTPNQQALYEQFLAELTGMKVVASNNVTPPPQQVATAQNLPQNNFG